MWGQPIPRKGFNQFEFLKGNFTILDRAKKIKSLRAVKELLTAYLKTNEKNTNKPQLCTGNYFVLIR